MLSARNKKQLNPAIILLAGGVLLGLCAATDVVGEYLKAIKLIPRLKYVGCKG